MKSILRLRRRIRLRIALLAIVALLFQQTALASYVCSLPDMPVGNMAMADHCDGMPMAQAQHDPGLCVWHCAQSPASAQTPNVPQVPPLAIAAVLPMTSPLVLALPSATARHSRDPVLRSRGLPPELRFTVLLI
ncbi:MAG: hypothetical protein J0H27_06670 [Xanthomonadales bacterium]|nr:hypothetical protein [Xanthomonadales bacterium]OJY84132.1 MAG: hypothetical protein BGP23_16345 [Xanthomonadales bacterium 66-474]